MIMLLDSSLWVDFTRARSPAPLKKFIAPFVLNPRPTWLNQCVLSCCDQPGQMRFVS